MKTARQCLISVTCVLFAGLVVSVPFPALAAEPSLNIAVSPSTTVAHNEEVTLTAQASDPAQVTSYRWAHVGGWHRISTQQTVTLGGTDWPNSPGTRTFQAIVTLNDGSQVIAEQSIVFTNPPPPPPPPDVSVSISVSPDTSVAHSEEVTLTAQASDPTQVASYRWAHVGGWHRISTQQAVTLGGTDWPNSPGTRTFQAIVTLNDGSQVTATQAISFTKPKPEDATLARIRRDFVGEATTVEEFVSALPGHHQSRAIFMLESQAGDAEFASPSMPRVISWGATADDLFSWGTNDQSPRYDEVEFITKEYGEWVFGVIDFAASPPALSKETEACHSCHVNGHPIWGLNYKWPGIYSFVAGDDHGYTAWLKDLKSSGDPRVTQVWTNPEYGVMTASITKALEMEEAVVTRHAEVLAESILPEEDAADRVKELLCPYGRDTALSTYGRGSDLDTAMAALFPVDHWPHAMRDDDGTVRDVAADRPLEFQNVWNESNANLHATLAMYLIDYLVDHEDAVRELYEGLANEESVAERPSGEKYLKYLHYPPETATALDELDSRSDIFFNLKGFANLNYRMDLTGTMTGDRRHQVAVRDGHLIAMIPKVCGVLYPEE